VRFLKRNYIKSIRKEIDTMPVYEVLVIEKPTDSEMDDGALETIVLQPTLIVAKDEKSASMKVLLDNKGPLSTKDAGRLEVLVRPF
jgi:hypothetical protein